MMTYILIGIIFMFCVEFLLSKDKFNQHISITLGWKERIMGILFWPVCVGIFFYNFFKQLLK